MTFIDLGNEGKLWVNDPHTVAAIVDNTMGIGSYVYIVGVPEPFLITTKPTDLVEQLNEYDLDDFLPVFDLNGEEDDRQ